MSASALSAKRTLSVWKAVEIGNIPKGELMGRVREEFKISGMNVVANEVMASDAWSVASRPTNVNLAVFSLDELGFESPPKVEDFLSDAFCKAWSRRNLKGQRIGLCEAEDGFQLRRQYADQPEGEHVIMGMEGIDDMSMMPRVLVLGHESEGGLRLNFLKADPVGEVNLAYRVAFRLHDVKSRRRT